MIKDKVLTKIFKDIAKEYNITLEEVENIHESQWCFVRETLDQLDLQSVETEEEFEKLKTNFNIPALGKFYVTFKSLNYVKERSEKARSRGEKA